MRRIDTFGGMEPKNPYVTASLLIEMYADHAIGEAVLRAVAMRIARNPYGEALWLDVLDAVVNLQDAEAVEERAVH
jgi:hypothetical protein